MPTLLAACRAPLLAVLLVVTVVQGGPAHATTAVKGESTTSTVEPRLLSDPNVVWVGTWERSDWRTLHGVGTFQNSAHTATPSLTDSGARGRALSGLTPRGQLQGFGYNASLDRNGVGFRDELYFRYRVLFRSTYQWTNSGGGGGGKLPGLAGKLTGGSTADNLDTKVGSGGRRWNGSNEVYRSNLADADGFSARLLWLKDGGLASYVYAQYPLGPPSSTSYFGATTRCKTSIGSSENKFFQKGTWNTVEQRVRMNTPGVRNGILQVWMNGTLCIDLRDVMWRSSKRTTLKITQMYMTWYYGGGSTDAPSNDSYVFIDDAVLSRAYIGPRR